MATDKKLIEKYYHSKVGYSPFLIGPKWQVAQLNYEPETNPDDITFVEVHRHTDETFLLMAGQAVLIAAELKEDKIEFELINMEPKVVYNLPKGCWHNIAMSKDAEVSITEDANTHLNDCEFHNLNGEEKKELKELIKSVWQD